MDNDNTSRTTDPQDNDKWGLIVILIFVLGLPLLGILAKLLGD